MLRTTNQTVKLTTYVHTATLLCNLLSILFFSAEPSGSSHAATMRIV